MATATALLPSTNGGAFLVENRTPAEIFTAEDLSDEHLAIARTVDEFWSKEVEPNLEAIQRHEPGVAREIVRKAAAAGSHRHHDSRKSLAAWNSTSPP